MNAEQSRCQAEKQEEPIVFFLQPCANTGAIGDISDNLRQGEEVHLFIQAAFATGMLSELL